MAKIRIMLADDHTLFRQGIRTLISAEADMEVVGEASNGGDAVDKANATSYGLTAGVVTKDLDVAKAFWSRVKAGLVKVNVPLTGTPFHIPLRGWRHSGVGTGEGGDVSVDFFTKQKAIYLRRPPMA